ncbi:ABCG2 protein, partial [Amia calva]|nr:ABCG2 protein [Amia calva]
LLDVLAARKNPSGLSGDVLIDGAPQPANFKCISGYVVQDDVVMGNLTVRENLLFSAALRLPTSISFKDKEERVANVISELGLTRVADSRVSIHPSVSCIKTITNQHFQKLCMSLPSYVCESYNNPPDFFLDVINGDSTAVTTSRAGPSRDDQDNAADKTVVDTLSEKYMDSTKFQSVQDALKNIEDRRGTNRNGRRMESITYATSFFTQLYWVTKRTFKNLIRNPQASVAQVLVNLILGLFTGVIFFGAKLDPTGIQNRVGALFFITTNQCFSSVSAIEVFIKEKKLFIHQYTSGYYRLLAYFFSILLGDLIPMGTVPGLVLSLITYWMMGFQRLPGNFFFFMFTVTMISYTATSLALAVGTGMDSVAVANLILTLCFILMYALQINEFRGLYFCGDKSNQSTSFQSAMANCLSNINPLGGVCYGEAYLCGQGIGYDNWAMWENIVALACMTVIFLSIAGIKLHTMKKYT